MISKLIHFLKFVKNIFNLEIFFRNVQKSSLLPSSSRSLSQCIYTGIFPPKISADFSALIRYKFLQKDISKQDWNACPIQFGSLRKWGRYINHFRWRKYDRKWKSDVYIEICNWFICSIFPNYPLKPRKEMCFLN